MTTPTTPTKSHTALFLTVSVLFGGNYMWAHFALESFSALEVACTKVDHIAVVTEFQFDTVPVIRANASKRKFPYSLRSTSDHEKKVPFRSLLQEQKVLSGCTDGMSVEEHSDFLSASFLAAAKDAFPLLKAEPKARWFGEYKLAEVWRAKPFCRDDSRASSVNEVAIAIRKQSNGRSPGQDDVVAELFKIGHGLSASMVAVEDAYEAFRTVPSASVSAAGSFACALVVAFVAFELVRVLILLASMLSFTDNPHKWAASFSTCPSMIAVAGWSFWLVSPWSFLQTSSDNSASRMPF